MPLSFPINDDDRFTLYDTVAGEVFTDSRGREKRNLQWSTKISTDLTQVPTGLDYPNLRFLRQIEVAKPVADTDYDPATHYVAKGDDVVDLTAETISNSWDITAFTQQELDANADTADRAAKLTAIGGKVATLRGWADTAGNTTVTTGNAVNVLQGVVDNLAQFYDGFADLLEGQRIDEN